MDLYQTSSRGAKVRVKDDSTNNVIFFGYLTPNVYDQDYTYLDTVQLEARDAVSTLQDYKFSSQGIYPSYQTIISTILSFLKECGYEGYINSEYEGQRDQQDMGFENLPDSVEQVRRHHEMLKRLIAK